MFISEGFQFLVEQQIYHFWLSKERGMNSFHYKFEPDVLNIYSVTWELKTQNFIQVIISVWAYSTFATQKIRHFGKLIYLLQ